MTTQRYTRYRRLVEELEWLAQDGGVQEYFGQRWILYVTALCIDLCDYLDKQEVEDHG